MRRRAEGTLKTVESLLLSDLSGRLQAGDSLGLWTFNQEVSAGRFPLQQWSPATRRAVADRVLEFLRGERYQNRADLAKVLAKALPLVTESDAITLVLVTTGSQAVRGTPFDEEIAAAFRDMRTPQQRVRLPVVTVLRAEGGRFVNHVVGQPPWPFAIPELPGEQAARAATKTPPAKPAKPQAPAKAEPTPASQPVASSQLPPAVAPAKPAEKPPAPKPVEPPRDVPLATKPEATPSAPAAAPVEAVKVQPAPPSPAPPTAKVSTPAAPTGVTVGVVKEQPSPVPEPPPAAPASAAAVPSVKPPPLPPVPTGVEAVSLVSPPSVAASSPRPATPVDRVQDSAQTTPAAATQPQAKPPLVEKPATPPSATEAKAGPVTAATPVPRVVDGSPKSGAPQAASPALPVAKPATPASPPTAEKPTEPIRLAESAKSSSVESARRAEDKPGDAALTTPPAVTAEAPRPPAPAKAPPAERPHQEIAQAFVAEAGPVIKPASAAPEVAASAPEAPPPVQTAVAAPPPFLSGPRLLGLGLLLLAVAAGLLYFIVRRPPVPAGHGSLITQSLDQQQSKPGNKPAPPPPGRP